MAIKYIDNNATGVNSGIKYNNTRENAPLDIRTVVDYYSDLELLKSSNRNPSNGFSQTAYNGMIIAVVNDNDDSKNGIYCYIEKYDNDGNVTSEEFIKMASEKTLSNIITDLNSMNISKVDKTELNVINTNLSRINYYDTNDDYVNSLFNGNESILTNGYFTKNNDESSTFTFQAGPNQDKLFMPYWDDINDCPVTKMVLSQLNSDVLVIPSTVTSLKIAVGGIRKLYLSKNSKLKEIDLSYNWDSIDIPSDGQELQVDLYNCENIEKIKIKNIVSLTKESYERLKSLKVIEIVSDYYTNQFYIDDNQTYELPESLEIIENNTTNNLSLGSYTNSIKHNYCIKFGKIIKEISPSIKLNSYYARGICSDYIRDRVYKDATSTRDIASAININIMFDDDYMKELLKRQITSTYYNNLDFIYEKYGNIDNYLNTSTLFKDGNGEWYYPFDKKNLYLDDIMDFDSISPDIIIPFYNIYNVKMTTFVLTCRVYDEFNISSLYIPKDTSVNSAVILNISGIFSLSESSRLLNRNNDSYFSLNLMSSELYLKNDDYLFNNFSFNIPGSKIKRLNVSYDTLSSSTESFHLFIPYVEELNLDYSRYNDILEFDSVYDGLKINFFNCRSYNVFRKLLTRSEYLYINNIPNLMDDTEDCNLQNESIEDFSNTDEYINFFTNKELKFKLRRDLINYKNKLDEFKRNFVLDKNNTLFNNMIYENGFFMIETEPGLYIKINLSDLGTEDEYVNYCDCNFELILIESNGQNIHYKLSNESFEDETQYIIEGDLSNPVYYEFSKASLSLSEYSQKAIEDICKTVQVDMEINVPKVGSTISDSVSYNKWTTYGSKYKILIPTIGSIYKLNNKPNENTLYFPEVLNKLYINGMDYTNNYLKVVNSIMNIPSSDIYDSADLLNWCDSPFISLINGADDEMASDFANVEKIEIVNIYNESRFGFGKYVSAIEIISSKPFDNDTPIQIKNFVNPNRIVDLL